jgi:hypothetical protein
MKPTPFGGVAKNILVAISWASEFASKFATASISCAVGKFLQHDQHGCVVNITVG